MPVSLASLLVTAILIQALPGDHAATVEGVAIVEGTESPVADVVIRFDGPGAPGEPVTTDDRGRFRRTPSENPEVRDGDRGPGCWVRTAATSGESHWIVSVTRSGTGHAVKVPRATRANS